ncbi:MAG: GNAT family N-acetyltransferase [Acidimicrobiales bacterium]
MDIRVARPDEYGTIGQITVDAYRHLVSGARYGSYEDELRAVAKHAEECVILAAVDESDTVVGSVTYVPRAGTSMSEFADTEAAGIRMLAVAPQSQGSGAGSALTEACIARARSDGRRRIVLHSTSRMEVARAMYERRGFVATPDLDLSVTMPPYSEAEPLRLIAYVLEL